MPKIRQLDDPRSAARLFAKLASRASQVRIVTAWGTPDAPVLPSLDKPHQNGKLELVVGLDFGGTHPRFLRKFRVSLRVPDSAGGSTFHPKAYLFVRNGTYDAIVGSSNLTRGGFDGNVELNLHLSGSTLDPTYRELSKYIQHQWDGAREVSEQDIDAYERGWRQFRRLGPHVAPPRPASPVAHARPQIVVDPKLDVGWTAFYNLLRQVDGSKHYVFPRANGESYLDVIAYVERSFARNHSLASMSRDERSNVAGTNTHSKFGYFGTTHSVGTFTHAVLESPGLVDRALDLIPRGTNRQVTRTQFESFFAEFERFAKSLHRPRPSVGCASRLLAMKRPDNFLCVNGENRARLAKAFGFSDAELRTAAGYWSLCEHVWALPWYKSPRPRDASQRSAWRARVALVDAFYYED